MLPINPLKKIAKQCGCKRISQKACELLAQYCEEYAINLVRRAKELSSHADRITILNRDIELARKSVTK